MNMNSKIAKVLIMLLAVMLLVAQAVPAMAISGSSGENGTTVSTSVPINKHLILDADANVPSASFSFQLQAASVTSGTVTNKFPVFAGITAGATVGTVTFTQNQTGATNGTASDGIANSTDKKYVTGSATVDFSGVEFPEPGVYRYVLTEVSGNTDGITYDNTTYYIDVYVEYADDETDDLTIGGIVMTSGTPATVGDTNATKVTSATFKNNYTTYTLEITKTVTGNQGSHTDAFPFKITLSEVPDGTYTVHYGNNQSATITVEDGEGEVTINLKHGESAKVEGLPDGAEWEIVETHGTYTASAKIGSADAGDEDASDTTYSVNGTIDEADAKVDFTNDRTGVIPTGVLMTIAPFVALILVGVLGAVIVLKKKKN